MSKNYKTIQGYETGYDAGTSGISRDSLLGGGAVQAQPETMPGYTAPDPSEGVFSSVKNFLGNAGPVAAFLSNPVAGFGIGVIKGIAGYIGQKRKEKKAEELLEKQARESRRRWDAEYEIAKEKLNMSKKEFIEQKRRQRKIEKENARLQRIQGGQAYVNGLMGTLNANRNLAASTLNTLRSGVNG